MEKREESKKKLRRLKASLSEKPSTNPGSKKNEFIFLIITALMLLSLIATLHTIVFY